MNIGRISFTGISRPYAKPSGTKRKICDEDNAVVATKSYGRLPSKPSRITVESGGGSRGSSEGEMDSAISLDEVVAAAAAVVCVFA